MSQERESLILRGVLDLCVMQLMESGPLYGYEVVTRLGAQGLTVAPGSVYPLLARLERARLVASKTSPSSLGPPRRWWQLTDTGTSTLREGRETWKRMAVAVSASLDNAHLAKGVEP